MTENPKRFGPDFPKIPLPERSFLRRIPFYSNINDQFAPKEDSPFGGYCHEMILKMILKDTFPDRDFSLLELKQITRRRQGSTFPTHSLINLQKMGFEPKGYNLLLG